jgi:hypothetical protein
MNSEVFIGSFTCAKPVAYVSGLGPLTFQFEGRTFRISSADGSLDDKGQFVVNAGNITLTIEGAEDDPITYAFSRTSDGFTLKIAGKSDCWVRKQ